MVCGWFVDWNILKPCRNGQWSYLYTECMPPWAKKLWCMPVAWHVTAGAGFRNQEMPWVHMADIHAIRGDKITCTRLENTWRCARERAGFWIAMSVIGRQTWRSRCVWGNREHENKHCTSSQMCTMPVATWLELYFSSIVYKGLYAGVTWHHCWLGWMK